VSTEETEESINRGLALQKTINIHASRLPDPPWTADKTIKPFVGSGHYLLSQPGPADSPHILASTALMALKNGRPWSDDENELVAALLEECGNQSKQSFLSLVKKRRPIRVRGRPKSTKPTVRTFKLGEIGRRIDELINQGVPQPEARSQGEREFSLSRRAIDLHHAKHKKFMKNINGPEARDQQRVRFNENYLSVHNDKRQEFRSKGRLFQTAASLLKSTGSVLHVQLYLVNLGSSLESDLLYLSIPPLDEHQCQALLSRKQSIHGALLHCVSPESQPIVTKREIIVQWPEDTVVQRIIDEAMKMAKDSDEYTLA
jgi:hypothetical protein